MKHSIYTIAALIGLSATSAFAQNSVEKASFGRSCHTMENLERIKAEDPAVAQSMAAIEQHTQGLIEAMRNGRQEAITGTIDIPVVVHVLYNTASQNISDAQIQSQIDVLNKDFQKLNADASKTPSEFAGRVANVEIKFHLATKTPTGAATNGIIRKSTKTSSWRTNDAMKYDAKGGSSAWDTKKYLNLWVCNLSNGILGYAQFPGGAAATDGVVILTSAFGVTSQGPYNLGRTATHEVGHWLNLRHIWGDASCGNDQVADTPTHASANYGCPSYPTVGCGNNMMTMNYMDYTDDACMYMFTEGQKTRMRALFEAGGARASLLTSTASVNNEEGTTESSVKAANKVSFEVYPNPTNTLANIKINAGERKDLSVVVYDVVGNKVYERAINGAFGVVDAELDVTSFKTGVYMVSVQGEGFRQVQKLMVK